MTEVKSDYITTAHIANGYVGSDKIASASPRRDAAPPPRHLACPFCGETARVHMTFDGSQAWGACRACHTTGPVGETEAEALERWNTRAADVTALFEEVLERCIWHAELTDKLTAHPTGHNAWNERTYAEYVRGRLAVLLGRDGD